MEQKKEKIETPSYIFEGNIIKVVFETPEGEKISELLLVAHTDPTLYKVISLITGNRWGRAFNACKGNAARVEFSELKRFFESTLTLANDKLVSIEVLGHVGEIDFYSILE